MAGGQRDENRRQKGGRQERTTEGRGGGEGNRARNAGGEVQNLKRGGDEPSTRAGRRPSQEAGLPLVVPGPTDGQRSQGLGSSATAQDFKFDLHQRMSALAPRASPRHPACAARPPTHPPTQPTTDEVTRDLSSLSSPHRRSCQAPSASRI